MTNVVSGSTRAIALVGAAGAGKTTLLEALLFASGAIPRQGAVEAGASVGDAAPEARQRRQSVELNLASFESQGVRYALIDVPGSTDFHRAGDHVLPAVDLAVVVADPHPARAALLQPVMKELEQLGVPRALFINKIDQAHGRLDELIAALQPCSTAPLVARQIPLLDGEQVTGFVDLALERAYVYRPGQPAQQIDLPDDVAALEAEARFHMLEQLADFDDALMEQLLSDLTPDRDGVFADLVQEMNQGQIVPVFFGSALNGFGVPRLLKALRHETPQPDRAARRLGLSEPALYAFKSSYANQAGKLTYARVLAGRLADGQDLTAASGEHMRAGGLFTCDAGALRKTDAAAPGEIVAVARLEHAAAGDILSIDGKPRAAPARPPAAIQFALVVAARDRKDDVRLSTALAKLVEEDGALTLTHNPESQETLLGGAGEAHLQVALDRLRRRFGVETVTSRPHIAYRESVRRGVTQRGRHKKQTGGHGQFGDVVIEVAPGPRGSGFSFSQRVTGGVVPKQWIPAVEQGVRDALAKGPLGFPVTDVAVTLIDGSSHSVDSSEMAFRAAGRLAMSEALKVCEPFLLEPIERLTIHAPNVATSKVTAALSARRGQILGFEPRDGWSGWDEISAFLPQQERIDWIAELRGLTQGLGEYASEFDHLSELGGRLADDVVRTATA